MPVRPIRGGLRAAVAGVVFALAGCGGDGLVNPPVRLTLGGRPFAPGAGEVVQLTFVPVTAAGQPPSDFYASRTDPDGTIRPAGKTGRGLPPGRYKVAVEVLAKRKDTLGGKYDADNTKFEFDFTAATKEIVLDLDVPPGGGKK